jgi:hypothetical protein
MALDKRDSDHLFQELRQGTVPQRGIDEIAVGIERQRAEVSRLLDMAQAGEGVFKFLRGGYGCGKTFMARLAALDAQRRGTQGFATSFVVVSDNDLKFHHFDELYGKIVTELATTSCPRGALGDVLDRWIGGIEEQLTQVGHDDGAPDFDDKVRERLQQQLASLTGGKAPQDMIRVLQAVFDAKQRGDLLTAGALQSWLAGSRNVATAAKKAAAIKGDIESASALSYLRGILEIVKAAGYEGLLIVVDEAETILRMRHDVRGKAMNAIRQIIDAAQDFPGLVWLFTGTPDFFDTKRGVAGLQPLYDRIKFTMHGQHASLRQPQLDLRPFDSTRLGNVAVRLRQTYRGVNPERIHAKVSDTFIARLVEEVTKGFAGDVGVVPRQFLRQFVEVLDLVDEDETFDPMQAHGFVPKDLTEDEKRLLAGEPPYEAEAADDAGYAVTSALEF